MASLSVYVDQYGIHAPDFTTVVLPGVQAVFQGIFGADIYLGADSQDGQLAAAIALMIHDCNMACVAAWNNFSPATAVGVGLSSMVKLNGLQRDSAVNSTAVVTITGAPYTVISNGVISDSTDPTNLPWNLPATVTIGSGSSVSVTATCSQPGAITAGAGNLTVMQNPQAGWSAVTNPAAATPGAAAESDGALRNRQSQSTSKSAQTIAAAILANVRAVPGVVSATIHVNDTSSTDSSGVPAKSFAVVVAGGDAVAVATAIMNAKGPGPATYGTTSETLTDSVGNTEVISFTVPTQVPIHVNITVKALTGFTTTVQAEIKQALSSSQAQNLSGTNVKWASLFLPAQLVLSTQAMADFFAHFGAPLQTADAVTYSVNALQIYRGSGPAAEADVVIAYNELATLVPANVIMTVV